MWQRPRKKVSRGLFLQSLIPLQSFHLLVLILDIERRGQKDTYLAEIDEFFTISRASDPFALSREASDTSRILHSGFRVEFNDIRVKVLDIRVGFVDIRVEVGASSCLFCAFRYLQRSFEGHFGPFKDLRRSFRSKKTPFEGSKGL